MSQTLAPADVSHYYQRLADLSTTPSACSGPRKPTTWLAGRAKMTVASGSRTQIEPYFKAWNAHDPEAVAAAFAEGGTYTDPVAAGPLPFVQRRHKQGTS